MSLYKNCSISKIISPWNFYEVLQGYYFVCCKYYVNSSFSFTFQHPFVSGKSGSSWYSTVEDTTFCICMLFESHNLTGYLFSYACIENKFQKPNDFFMAVKCFLWSCTAWHTLLSSYPSVCQSFKSAASGFILNWNCLFTCDIHASLLALL